MEQLKILSIVAMLCKHPSRDSMQECTAKYIHCVRVNAVKIIDKTLKSERINLDAISEGLKVCMQKVDLFKEK